MITNTFQKKAYDAVVDALPFAIDPTKITVEPGLSYCISPIKVHDYATGVMAAFGSVVEYLGRLRGLPEQTMTLNRRRSGLLMNSLQMHFVNGYSATRHSGSTSDSAVCNRQEELCRNCVTALVGAVAEAVGRHTEGVHAKFGHGRLLDCRCHGILES